MDLENWEVWDVKTNKDEVEIKVLSESEIIDNESVFGSPIDKEIELLFADINSEAMISSEPIPSTSDPFISTSQPFASASEPLPSIPETLVLTENSTDSLTAPYEQMESIIELLTTPTCKNNTNRYECKGCGKKFVRWEAHYIHTKFKCPLGTYRGKSFECPICLEYKVSKRMAIALHVASHKKSKKTCPLCNQLLNQSLPQHLYRSHFIDIPNLEVN